MILKSIHLAKTFCLQKFRQGILNGAYCQVKVSYGYRNGKGGKVVHNAETSKARLGL